MENHNVYQETFRLRTCDCDFTGSWRPSAILTAMQEAAGAHSEQLGCGRDALLRNGVVWVVTRLEVRMDRYPTVGDMVTVETFPAALRRWFFPRYYLFKSRDGEPLGCAGTLWVLLNLKDRKMASPGAVASTLPDNSGLTPPMGMPGAVDTLDAAPAESLRTPGYFDLDVNLHVNNTRYADWACDALGVETMKEYCLKTLRINFDAEIRPDQDIRLQLFRAGDAFRVAGWHGDRLHFDLGGTLARRDPFPEVTP